MRRPLFQLHLSTAIVLMFVAAALLWANLYGYRPNQYPNGYSVAGWPQIVYLAANPEAPRPRYLRPGYYAPSFRGAEPLATDIIVVIAVLITATFLCEFLTSRPRPDLRSHALTTLIAVVAAFSAGGIWGANAGAWPERYVPLVSSGSLENLLLCACFPISLAVLSELILRRFFPRNLPAAQNQKPQT